MAADPVGLKRLIKKHRQLLARCQAALQEFPGPIPDSLPRLNPPLVPRPNQPPQPLSEEQKKEYEKREKERAELLAVHFPFQTAYRPGEGDTPTPGQRAGIEIRNLLDSAASGLRDLYDQDQHALQAFPLANWGTNFGRSTNMGQVIQAIDRQIKLLSSRLNELGGGQRHKFEQMRLDLRQAIQDAGVDNGSAAREINVSRDSLEDFLAGRVLTPRHQSLEKYKDFVAKHRH